MGEPGFASVTLTIWLISCPGSLGQARADLPLSQASVRPHMIVSRTFWTPGQLGSFQTWGKLPQAPALPLYPGTADSGNLGPWVLFRLLYVCMQPWVVAAPSPGHQPQALSHREGHQGEAQPSGSSAPMLWRGPHLGWGLKPTVHSCVALELLPAPQPVICLRG